MGDSVPAQPRRRARRGLEISLFLLVVVIAAVLVIGMMCGLAVPNKSARRVRRVWRLGTVVLFEGDDEYTNPPFTPREWDVELGRSWLDDLFAASPTVILFVRPSRSVGWQEPVVDDDDIPELIAILRELPTITQVTLDKNITPAGKSRLERAMPAVRFMPPRVP